MPAVPDRTSFTSVVRGHVARTPNQRILSFLSVGAEPEIHFTYGELDRRARAIASVLQQQCARGDRVLLLQAPGLEYVATFVACLYAGLVAVPAYPPDLGRLTASLGRLTRLSADAQPSMAVTTAPLDGIGDEITGHGGPPLRWLATEVISDDVAENWLPVSPSPDDLAFLQYTSGTTRRPRGVRLTHRNLVATSEVIRASMGHDRDCRGVIWLPPYHDMGLIGGILQPLYVGFACELMSPLTFLRSPLAWLERIDGQRRVTAGGPNFAFDLCVAKTSPEDRQRLDLSGWTVAFCGAEPVRADTLTRFAEAFECSGFQRQNLFPCYGLAEATLMVSGHRCPEGPIRLPVDPEALSRGEIRPPVGPARTLVSSGPVVADHEVRIVEPDPPRPAPADVVGEIWVAGPSVADGYWADPHESEQVFGATLLPDGTGKRYLRTGDLGFVADGQLYIAGRRSDVIIVGGRNFHPHDLEQTAESSHPDARPGGCVAFGDDSAGVEQVVLVQEVRAGRAAGPLLESIRNAVADEHAIMPDVIVLVPPSSVAKTSSGKLQRARCREDYRHERLRVLARWRLTDPPPPGTGRPRLDGPVWRRHDDLVRYLTQRVGDALMKDGAPVIDPHTGFIEMGISSVRAVQIRNRVQSELNIPLPTSLLFDHPTIDALARYLGAVLPAHGHPAPDDRPPAPQRSEVPA